MTSQNIVSLVLLQDSEILRELAATDVVNCLVDDVPLANNDGDYNMDYKVDSACSDLPTCTW